MPADSSRAQREEVICGLWASLRHDSGVPLMHLAMMLTAELSTEVSSELQEKVDGRLASGRRSLPTPWPSLDRFLTQTDAERDVFAGLSQLYLHYPRGAVWLEPLVDLVFESRQNPHLLLTLRGVNMQQAHLFERQRALDIRLEVDALSPAEALAINGALDDLSRRLDEVAAAVWQLASDIDARRNGPFTRSDHQ